MRTPSSDPVRQHVKAISSQAVDVIEKEHGVVGLDHLLEIVQERINTAVMQAMEEREKSLT